MAKWSDESVKYNAILAV